MVSINDGSYNSQLSSTSTAASDISSPAPVARGQGEHEAVRDVRQLTDINEDDPDLLEEVIMAISVTNRGTVGCAYYSAHNERLLCMEDLQLAGPDAVEPLKLYIDPSMVLVPTNCSTETMERLDPEKRNAISSREEHDTEQSRLPSLLECRPNSEFGYESALNKLAGLRLPRPGTSQVTFVVPGDTVDEGNTSRAPAAGRQDLLLRLAGQINLESRISVGCAGAVLSYLQRRRAISFLPGDRSAFEAYRVSAVEMFTLADTMLINVDTLLTLQITSTESHPNVQQHGPAGNKSSSGGAKEGLSLYGVFHPYAKTPQGRALLRQIFLRPSLDLAVINERLQSVGILLQAENLPCLDSLPKALAKVRNMRKSMIDLRKGVSVGLAQKRDVRTTVWQNLRYFLFSALQISDIFRELRGASGLAISKIIAETFETRQMAQIGRLISEVVDFETTKDQRRISVLPGVDAELDETKRTFDGIEDLLSQVADHIAGQVPALVNSQVNVIFFPQIGFLISMELQPNSMDAVYHGTDVEPWERMFATESHAYYKNSHMNELDQEFGDVYGRICDKEIEIIQALTQRVLEYEDLFNSASDVCGELDCLVAFTKVAQLYNLTRPQMSQENVLKIRSGRHLLQELTVPAFVPNDTCIIGGSGNGTSLDSSAASSQNQEQAAPQPSTERLESQTPHMVLLTGPNYSGKSVYLKQVAVITFLAHIGSYVPAESAEIGVTDKILTRIAARESVSKTASTFAMDLQQISQILRMATRRSLVIIDEFGKGTESNDGAGLAAGVFEHLLRRGNECPKVLGATHFHEIFECGYLQPRPTLEFGHMEVRVDSEASDVEGQVTYLYNYRQGRSTSSFGTWCAAANGIDSEIVNRAEELILASIRGRDLVESCAQVPQAELRELTEAESTARQFLAIENFNDPRKALHDLLNQSTAGSKR